ncbi:MAG: multiheme c-type cytochrome [Calditrichia bacterium]
MLIRSVCVQSQFSQIVIYLFLFLLCLFVTSGWAQEDSLDAKAAHDALFAESRFPSASTCKTCHASHYEEWSVSAHAYAQLSPVFNAMHAEIVQRTNGTNGDFCIRCHTPVGMNLEEPVFMSNLDRHPTSREGITCISCHRVNKPYGKISGRQALLEGDIFDKVYGSRGNVNLQEAVESGKYNIQPQRGKAGRPVHAEAEKSFYLVTPSFCGSCHDVNLFNGFRLEEAFSDFKTSPASGQGITCQDCHMGKQPGVFLGEDNYDIAPAAVIGGRPTPPRKRTNHMFAGPDYSIVHPGIFPHNVEAQKLATLREWLQFDYKAGWGEDEFEEQIDEDNEFPTYQLRDISFSKLKADRVPNSILERLSGLNNTVIQTEDDFLRHLARTGVYKIVEYKEPILKHARIDLDKFRWGTRDDRVEGRDIIKTNQDLLEKISEQRHQVLRAGIVLGDIVVDQVDNDKIKFKVQVSNGTNGHSVPTGFDAERLFYLRVTVLDKNDNVVFESGDLDPNGDVRDLHSLYVHDGKLPLDEQLFSLQSRFLVRMNRGGEREQVLAVNYSLDPLPFIRPSTRSTAILGRPVGARKHRQVIPPLQSRWPEYVVSEDDLKGTSGPYQLNVKFIAQMVPINLIFEIQSVGFDYNMSPREIADAILAGQQVLYDRTIPLETGRFTPSDARILSNHSTSNLGGN